MAHRRWNQQANQSRTQITSLLDKIEDFILSPNENESTPVLKEVSTRLIDDIELFFEVMRKNIQDFKRLK